MALHLDPRQRAMLREMGVRVWLPGTDFATVSPAAADSAPAMPSRPAPSLAPPATTSATPTPASIARPSATPPASAGDARLAPSPASTPARAARPAPSLPAAAPAAGGTAGSGVTPALEGLDWAGVAQVAADCQACGMCAGRKHSTLHAHAPPQADWMVVGDPPDEHEDSAGQPFVEDPGLLLSNMLKAVGVSRTGQGATGAYATNIVKCRPPYGRNPSPADLAQCAHFLQREIAQVQPKVIFAVGRFAIQTLLSEHGALATQPLGKLRGTVYRYRGIPVVVSYPPQLLLRNSADKAKAWADLCLAMDALASS